MNGNPHDRLWAGALQSKDLMTNFRRLVEINAQNRRTGGLPALPSAARSSPQFTSFMSVIISPESNGFLSDLLSHFYENFDMETILSLFAREKAEDIPDVSIDSLLHLKQLLEDRNPGGPSGPLAQLEEIIGLVRDKLGPGYFEEEFKISELALGSPKELQVSIDRHSGYLHLINRYVYLRINNNFNTFYQVVSNFNTFDDSAASVLGYQAQLTEKLAKLKTVLLSDIQVIQIKIRKKIVLENLRKQLETVKHVLKADEATRRLLERKDYKKVSDILVVLKTGFDASLLKTDVFANLNSKIESRKAAFFQSLVSHAVSSLSAIFENSLAVFKRYLDFFEEGSPSLGREAFGKHDLSSLSIILTEIRQFCNEAFLDDMRTSLNSLLRGFHKSYVELATKKIALKIPRLNVVSSYTVMMCEINSTYLQVLSMLGQESEKPEFTKFVANQGNKFLRELIANFELDQSSVDSIQDFAGAIGGFLQGLSVSPDSKLFALLPWFKQLVLNAQQQKLLGNLKLSFEEEPWTVSELTDPEQILLRDLVKGQESEVNSRGATVSKTSFAFFRCLLDFLRHLQNIFQYRHHFPDIRPDVDSKSKEATEVFVDKLEGFLLLGQAIKFGKLQKINTRVLSQGVLQLEFLLIVLPSVLPPEAEKSLSKTIEASTLAFIRKMVEVVESVITRYTLTFFETDWNNETQRVIIPTKASQEIVKTVLQLHRAVSEILPKRHLETLMGEVMRVLSDRFVNRIQTDLEIKKEFAYRLMCDEIDYLTQNFVEVFEKKAGVNAQALVLSLKAIESIKVIYVS